MFGIWAKKVREIDWEKIFDISDFGVEW